jgi:hypothetical protein
MSIQSLIMAAALAYFVGWLTGFVIVVVGKLPFIAGRE